MVRSHRRVAVPVGSKRPVSDIDGGGKSKKPSEDERVKRARQVQNAAEESKAVAQLSSESRVSFTRNLSSSFKQQCADMMKNSKVDKSNCKTLQMRSIESTQLSTFFKVDYYSFLRKPTAKEKLCTNALSGHCVGMQLGPLGPLVATKGSKAVMASDGKIGYCVACRVALAQQAALGNMLSGQISDVRPTELTSFEDSLRVLVNNSGTDNEMEFMPGTTWNAPYTFDAHSKVGSHFGTVHHTPLLLDNLEVSADKTRYIPHGFEFKDGGLLHRQPDKNVPNLALSFF